MAAIEYGSYYWCVILNGKEQNVPGESVFLHADELAIDPTAALIFKSAGRRPAGMRWHGLRPNPVRAQFGAGRIGRSERARVVWQIQVRAGTSPGPHA